MKAGRQFHYFEAWFLSFFWPGLYREVAQKWRGTGFAYLLLLLAICWIPASILVTTAYFEFNKNVLPALIKDFPVVTFTEGKLSIDRPMPYLIKDTLTGKTILIVDTTGKITTLDGKIDTVALVTQNSLIYKRNASTTETVAFPAKMNFTVTPGAIQQVGKSFGTVVLLGFYPLMVLSTWVYRSLQAIIYAAIGTLVFAKMMKSKLGYEAILRISVVAVTPTIIIGTVLDFMGLIIPYQLLLYFLLTMFYLIFGIYVNKPIAKG